MINVIYEDNHLLVVEKPANMPMVLDESKDLDLLTMAKQYIKEKYNKPGEVYLGLVHRLDRPVSGICVFARTSKAAARLSELIRKNQFHKEYIAVVQNNNLQNEACLEDYLLKNEKTNTTIVHPNGKYAKLEYHILAKNNELALIKIILHTGRSHQIRVQFASRNHPLFGDQRYNKQAKKGQQIALFSHQLRFMHPTLKQEMTFTLVPKNVYPYNIFKGGVYENHTK